MEFMISPVFLSKFDRLKCPIFKFEKESIVGDFISLLEALLRKNAKTAVHKKLVNNNFLLSLVNDNNPMRNVRNINCTAYSDNKLTKEIFGDITQIVVSVINITEVVYVNSLFILYTNRVFYKIIRSFLLN